jgi:hypothetical protein
MHSNLLRFALAAFAIKLCAAQTPPDFEPATSNHLTVTYGTSAINPAGITVPVTGKYQALGQSPQTVIYLMLSFNSCDQRLYIHQALGSPAPTSDHTSWL